MYEVFIPASFAVAIASNSIIGTSGIAGNTVASVSGKYRTAVTPAGYAFAIWGPIYLTGAGFAVYCALNPSFASRVGPFATANFALNALWIPLWTAEQRVPAFAAICGMLYTQTRVWELCGSPSGPASSQLEWMATRPFCSLYTAWLCVATTVSVAATLTDPKNVRAPFLGLSTQTWGRAVSVVAAALLGGLGVWGKDAGFPAVAAWALLAIAKRQREEPAYPGGSAVASWAEPLGWASAALSVGLLAMQLWQGTK